ncbi:MAG: sugar phosphate nucleotidyltransferase [Phyllobacterium sp.]|uniref:mannose-1-phosphate guanylyltransferase n=1 Tax=Phyllobacterium sp. TaxID=1871046 RepID=UPI0030F0CA75
MTDLYPLVLCGGIGTRLWPLSRAHQPKQFQPVGGEGSLSFFQETVQRHRSAAFCEPIICVSERHFQTTTRQLRDLQCKARVITEPVSRNTGPAVLAAALCLISENKDAVLVVLPSDHMIRGDINRLIVDMCPAAHDGLIVTIGVEPRYPEKGYGYIMDGGEFDHYPGLHRVDRFIEKPNDGLAQSLIDTGLAYWASGISMFRADRIIEEYQIYDPGTYHAVSAALRSAKPLPSAAGLVLDESCFSQATSLPTEKAVFERTRHIALAPAAIEWDDVGAWNAFHAIGDKSESGNVASGDVMLMDTSGSLVRGGDRLVAVVGMSDVVIVDTDDALLVTNRASAQDVKKIVEQLVLLKRREAECHRTEITLWGSLRHLQRGRGFTMDLLSIDAGNALEIEGATGISRMLAVVKGSLQLVQGRSHKLIAAGTSQMLDAAMNAMLINRRDTVAEVIEISLTIEAANVSPPLHSLQSDLGRIDYA